MLKAVKECVKNWLVTHERLYWYIVVGLAVLGFGIVTAMGCAKLEQANAAEDVQTNFDFLYSSRTYGYAQEYLENNLGENQYYCIFARDQFVSSSDRLITDKEYSMVVVIGNSSTLQVTESKNANGDVEDVFIPSCGYAYINGSDKVLSESTSFRFETGWLAHQTHVYYLEGNMDIASVLSKYSKITVHEKPIVTTYDANAPYIKFDSLDIYCPLATTPQTFKQNADITEIYKDYENWYWQYNGSIVNNSDIVPEEYALSVAFTVQLPTYDYVSELYVLGVVRQYLMPKNVPASVKEWMASDTDFVEYTFTHEFVLDVASDGTFSLKIPYSVIHGLMVYAYPDLLETFGTCTESDIDFCDIWMAHLYVEQCDSLLTVTSGGNEYYGRSVMNIFSKGIINRAVTAEVLVDILNATDAELESAISDALKIGYDEALKQNQADMDNMQNDLDSIFEVDGAFSGNLEGTDLWSGFSNLSEGMASLGPSIKQLSSLTGSVFAFIPAPIASIISFTLFAICIIAIIKAIRG